MTIQPLIEKLTPEAQPIARQVLTELEFIQKTLSELKQTIENEGVVDSTGKTMKESPALKSYNSTVKSFSYLLKQLECILRKNGAPPDAEDNLQAWLKASKK